MSRILQIICYIFITDKQRNDICSSLFSKVFLNFYLVLCGRSYLFVNDDPGPANIGDKSSMLSTGNYAISVHPLLSLVAEYSLSLEDFFQLFENYERNSTIFEKFNFNRSLMFYFITLRQGQRKWDIQKVHWLLRFMILF